MQVMVKAWWVGDRAWHMWSVAGLACVAGGEGMPRGVSHATRCVAGLVVCLPEVFLVIVAMD